MPSSIHRTLRSATVLGLVAAFVWASAATASAQRDAIEVVMMASDETPAVGETFQIQIEARITGSQVGGTLVPPAFGSLRVVGSTGQMRTQSMHQVFGAPPEIESRTVMGYMLVADRPGAYTIAGANFRMGRRTVSSDPLVIKVGDSSAVVAPPAAATAAGDAYEYDRDVFLRATVDDNEPYVGEQITYTLYLYTRVDGEPELVQRPTTDGFWMHGLLAPQRPMTPDYQVVRGIHYRVYVLDRFALFAERPGELEIGGAALEMEIGGVLGRMTGRSESVRRSCPPIRVAARALPAGARPGTIVGTATIAADVDRTRLRTGEAATLTLTLVAEGALRDTNLTLAPIDGLRVEPSSVEDQIESPRDLVGGVRRIRIPVVPLRAGTFTIPPFAIQTLDEATGELATHTTQPIELTATGPTIDDPAIAPPDEADDEDEEPTDDALVFGPVRPHASMRRHEPPVHARPSFFVLALAPLLGLALFLGSSRLRELLARRAVRGATTVDPKRALSEAKKALSRGEAAPFYAATGLALHRAIERRTSARSSGMTHAEIRTHLTEAGFESELIDRIVDELDGADFARFGATSATKDEMARALERTQALLERLEKSTLPEAPR